jgi:ribonuclease HI
MVSLTLNTDGGSRGNPGPAAIGAVIYDSAGKELQRLSKTIGSTTNNQAEYQALVMALKWVLENYGPASVLARLDSELVVRQLKGEYKMKNIELRPWYEKIHVLIEHLGGNVKFEHVPRERNVLADKLVNDALDHISN